jgi:hypothetical protein
MFRRFREVLVSILQMFIPPPSLPSMKSYNFPDSDRVSLVENYEMHTYSIKADNGAPKNSRTTIE